MPFAMSLPGTFYPDVLRPRHDEDFNYYGSSIKIFLLNAEIQGTLYDSINSIVELDCSTFTLNQIVTINEEQSNNVLYKKFIRSAEIDPNTLELIDTEWSEWRPYDQDNSNYLPLTAGEENKISGPLGFETVMYGSELPESGFEGQLFFLEDNSIEVPTGGTSGQVLTKNSNTDGDISWQDALPQGGTAGQYLAKNSNTNGDYVWKTTTVSNTIGSGTTAGPTVKTTVNGVAGSAVTIPTATASNSGVITTGNQSFAGTKTFKALHVEDNAISFKNTSVTKGTAPSANDGLYIQFCDSAGVAGANRYGMLYSDITTSNLGRMFMYAYAPVAGSTDSAYIYVQRGADGTSKAGSSAPFYGAVWNDYAEFRSQKENIEPGYCVASADDGKVYKTTEKFQACDGIVSDTFGFSIGETDECKTPLAVAGRVLAYCEGNRYDYHAGDTVCAGPDGKVCKMSREEIREWPDRIIGIVSEIPEYKRWGDGDVPVNNRIWIKVK